MPTQLTLLPGNNSIQGSVWRACCEWPGGALVLVESGRVQRRSMISTGSGKGDEVFFWAGADSTQPVRPSDATLVGHKFGG